MQIAKYFVAAGLTVLWPSCAWAGIYIAPLDGLKGVYTTDGDLAPVGKTVSFDFGQRFTRIDDVRIQLRGTIAPGLWGVRSLVGERSETRPEIFPPLELLVHTAGDHTVGGDAELRTDGAFDVELTLTRFRAPDWGFLKEGRADLDFQLWGPAFTADVVAWQIVPGIAGITEATLIIKGQAVPEPAGASVVLLAISTMALWRGRRN